MKQFFTAMSMERWVIVISLVAALSLGSLGFFKFHRERVELEQALAYDVKKLAEDTLSGALKYSKLFKEADLLDLTPGGTNSNMESYIRGIAARGETALGQVNVTNKEGNSPRKGVRDMRYSIDPQNKERAFSRIGIANFLYLLESEGHRLRVSHLRMQLSPKNLKEYEIPPGPAANEQWFWEAELISRQKSEAAAK